MRAIVLTEPGPVENLQIRELPVPDPPPGWVRIAVKAFGLNRSDHHMRTGLAEGVRYPIVPGLEAVGIVDAAPDSDLRPGQQVAALTGGMGRAYNGGYAEYTVVPRGAVAPFDSPLPWGVLGAVPETLQTAHGSLTTGLDLQLGQTLLTRPDPVRPRRSRPGHLTAPASTAERNSDAAWYDRKRPGPQGTARR